MTAVVGPNGCGKSNIADALRWVMGEQSAKSVRGERMFDMIFAGAKSRKAMNYAEVAVTFTDIGEQLKVDYDELVIKRRIYRSGESEYSINGQTVRLKDIQSLLWDSGKAFSQIGQGQMERMITLKPTERRYIFEEAAGISRFKQRKKETQAKLDRTSDNLTRIADIHREVEKQRDELAKQAEVAKNYKQNKAELERLEKGVLLEKWCLSENEVHTLAKILEQLDEKEETLDLNLSEKRQSLAEKNLKKEECEKERDAKKECCYQQEKEWELKQAELRSVEERNQEQVLRENKHLKDLELLLKRRTSAKKEFETSQAKQNLIKEKLGDSEHELDKQRTELQDLEEELEDLRLRVREGQIEHLELVREENRHQTQAQENQLRVESLTERLETFTSKRQELVNELTEQEQVMEEKRELLADLTESVNKEKKDFNQIEKVLSDSLAAIEQHELRQNEITKEFTEKQARQKVLQHLKDDMEGLSSGSKRLLKEAANEKSVLYGKLRGLFEMVSVNSPYESAVAAVLQRYAQTLVVKTRGDLNDVLQFIKEEALKECSLFCMEDLIDSKELSPAAAENDSIAQHFLCDQSFVKNLTKTSSPSTVTLDGHFIDHKVVLFWGEQGHQNVFLREAEINNLNTAIRSLESELKTFEQNLQALYQKRDDTQNQRAKADKAVRQLEMTVIEVNFSLQRVTEDIKRMRIEKDTIDGESKALTDTLAPLHKKLEVSSKEARQLALRLEKEQRRLSALDEELEKKSRSVHEKNQRLKDHDRVIKEMAEENQRLTNICNIYDVKDKESFDQEAKMNEELKLCLDKKEEIVQHLAELKAGFQTSDLAVKEGKKELKETESNLKNSLNELHRVDKELHAVLGEKQKNEKEQHRNEIALAQKKAARDTHAEELHQRCQLTIEEAQTLDLKITSTLEEAEKRVKKLRQFVDSAGDVNMMSIEEFDKSQQRFDFLDQQIGDLDSARKELEDIIAQLDKESRKLFTATFERIRDHFRKNFAILFSGGEADLKLTDSGDVLDAGIEIIAQPPGKQMRSIQLLSGGEKCMTAIALLFALFEEKSAPFCLLDEIDAPLDDANVDRFVGLLQQFIKTTQFIIITHNKRTMAAADTLFGVSMQEKGVSKLLSVRFEKDEVNEPMVLVEQA